MTQWYQTLTLMIAFATLVVLILQFAYNMTKKK
ncbi:putative holin-like toxin [Acididesulfobacillus acetoxydans]